jgi:Ca2+-binding RTX toxin-like protein
MNGSAGANQFIFSAAGQNTVTDFSAASRDKLVFSNSGFDLDLSGATDTAQKLPGSLFVANHAGKFTTTTQRFAYDTQTRQLYYDAGGSPTPAAKHLVVTLDSHPALVAGNLFFIR